MRLGVTLRNMGVESTRELMGFGAQCAEKAGLESLWVVDHVAIPPDDAEGSGGRYLDPLGSLAWLAGRTERIKLGVGVLILPYRPSLPTAKLIATVQELSAERLLLGVGIGWMEAEFKALGVARNQRGRLADATLEFFNACFEDDQVSLNEQPFLFKPRPSKPPILVGGGPPHALQRAVRYGDGWLPMGLSPQKLAPKVAQLQTLAQEAGRPPMEVTAFTQLPIEDANAAADMLAAYAEAGADRVVHGMRYSTADDYSRGVDALALQLS